MFYFEIGFSWLKKLLIFRQFKFLNINLGLIGSLIDIWALGITFYSFIYKDIPFKGDNF